MATSSADPRADPLAQDSDPEAILRHLHAVPSPRAPVGALPDDPPRWAPPPPSGLTEGAQTRRAFATVDGTQKQPPFAFADPPPALKMLQTAKAIGSIVMTRILLLLVLLCAGGLWALTVYDPLPYRIAASAIFSAMVLWPLCWVASRR